MWTGFCKWNSSGGNFHFSGLKIILGAYSNMTSRKQWIKIEPLSDLLKPTYLPDSSYIPMGLI